MAGFLGRAEELAAIRESCARARRDSAPTAIVLEGDPGVGKSRLLAEALRRVPIDARATVAGYEPEREVPFALGQSILRALADSSARARDWLAPALAPASPSAPRDWTGLFEAAHRATSLSAPIVLAIDDVQWADERSTALLHYLIRGELAEEAALAVVVSGRRSPETNSLALSLERLLADRFARIALGPLDHATSVRLVRAANPALDEATSDRLATRAAGSPFWCELLATARGETDVAGIVAARLGSARTDAAAALVTIALLSRPLELTEVGEIHTWSEPRARAAVAELAGTGLVVQAGTSVRMAHDLVRSAVDLQIGEAARRAGLRRISSWLEQNAGDDVTSLLAALDHRRQAGIDPSALARRILGAPKRRLAGLQGLGVLSEVVDGTSPDDPHEIELQRGVATLASELAQHAPAMDRWAAVAERVPDSLDRARAWLAASHAAHALGKTGETRVFLEHARESAGSDATLSIELDTADAEATLWLEHRPEEAHRLAVRALERARDLAARSMQAMEPHVRKAYLGAMRVASLDAQQRNAPEEMLTLADEMSQVAAGSDVEAWLEARERRGAALMWVGRFAEADEALSSAWRDAGRASLVGHALAIGWYLAEVRRQRGKLFEAAEIAAEIEALADRIDERTRVAYGAERWIIEISHGDRITALDRLREAVAGEPDRHQRIGLHATITRWLARLDGEKAADEIRSRLQSGRADAAAVGCIRCAEEFRLFGVETLARIGALTEAGEWMESAGRGRSPEGALQMWQQLRARASLASPGSAGEGLLEDLVAGADRIESMLEAVWARIDLARLLVGTDSVRASSIFQEARDLAEGMGARTEQQLIEQELRRLGVRTWRRGPSGKEGGLGTLTEREQEVARLVAGGASNVDIAQALFLSRKTVERHVSSVLQKLDVKNRAALAAAIAKLDHGAR